MDIPESILIQRRRERFTRAQARRIALAAQGFGTGRPGIITRGNVARTLDRLGLVQIDSVNVLARAHYMPLFSRLGAYDPALLDEAAYHRRRRSLFEYWGHEASLVRLDLQPLLRWRMERAARGEGIYAGVARFGRERPDFIETVLRAVRERGPLSAGELTDGDAIQTLKGPGGWWGWSDGKRALEWLFWAGRVTTATRRGFERVYDLPERVFPDAVLAAPTPDAEVAQRALMRHAARALGIASERCLRDYFRLGIADARARLAELVEEGALWPVAVEGLKEPFYLDPEARIPRRIEARALVSPFDPLVWERTRAERLFDFHYRIEIYTPAEKREFGYYCLPFLLGDRIVARLDLKADRAGKRLIVHSVHPEAGVAPGDIASPLSAELTLLSEWLKLDDIVTPAGWRKPLGF